MLKFFDWFFFMLFVLRTQAGTTSVYFMIATAKYNTKRFFLLLAFDE